VTQSGVIPTQCNGAPPRQIVIEHVPALSDKVSGSQFIDLSAVGIGIKTEVEVVQGAYFTEVG